MTTISDPHPSDQSQGEEPILACIDFSEDSKAALLWASHFAAACNRPLILLHVVHDLAAHPGFYHPQKSDHPEPMLDVAEEMMDEFLTRSKSTHPELSALASAGIRLVPGLPATRIVEVAALLKASLIVMGGHGMTHHSRKRLGTVVEHVAELSEIPVVIVKSDQDGRMSKKEVKRRNKLLKKEKKMLKKLLGVAREDDGKEAADG